MWRSIVPGSRYKWVALSNTTLGVLMATVNSSIMLIALPDIFRGIGVNPLQGIYLPIHGYSFERTPLWAGIMNSLPPERHGVGAGMSATFQNSSMVLSIGIFFTLIILGLASSLPATLSHGLVAQGVPAADAARLAALPPVSIMFAALRGRRYVHDEHAAPAPEVASAEVGSGDDLEGGQAGVGGVGDPAAVGRHLA